MPEKHMMPRRSRGGQTRNFPESQAPARKKAVPRRGMPRRSRGGQTRNFPESQAPARRSVPTHSCAGNLELQPPEEVAESAE